MPESTHSATAGVADDLFDRYALPKAALAMILVASFVGTAVSVRLAGDWLLPLAAAKWGVLVALGVLAGGLLWKHAFVRPGDVRTGAGGYCERMYDRFDRIAVGAVVALVPASLFVLRRYAVAGVDDVVVVALSSLLAALAVAVVVGAARNASVETQFRRPLGLASLALAFAAIGLVAFAEVSLGGGDAAAVGVRLLHLVAFAVWLGGAVWNIFVAVPSGQVRPTIDVVRAAGQQLERFRWAVRAIIPTIALTGAYQAVDALGASVGVYVGSLVGLAVLAKLAVIGVLVVIFKLCPMWRACSPIEGVCDIAAGSGSDDAESDAESDNAGDGTTPASTTDPSGRGVVDD